jgi:predicted extracellular nuclease
LAAIFTMGLLAGSLPLVLAAPAAAQTSVFINEIHYDNTGTDAGESIEVAGPAGTDLTGWTIVLYNQTGGATYDTDSLPAGPITDLGDGFGVAVVTYPVNGIQNGPSDGIALVDPSSVVVQFLSYEGTLTATNGPAAGMTSVDIGVSESGAGAVGNSLQLTGTGTTYEDFTWAAEATNTFGATNTGQTFNAGGGAPPWVNEIHYDNTGIDAGESIEVAGPAGTDLSGWTIVLYNGSNGMVYDTDALPAGPIADLGDGFGVAVLNYPANGIQNGSPDAVALVDPANTVVQFLSYEGTLTAIDGPAAGMTSIDIGVSENGSGAVGNSLQLTGTGTTYEDFTWAAEAPNTFGAANTGQTFGDGPPPFSCEGPATLTLISAIQGNGSTSPLEGQAVVVQAAVTASMPGLSGFYVQEEDAEADGDPATSEGVFVFSAIPAGVAVGDVVRISATVSEFETSGGLSSLTELTGATIAECAVDPVAVTPTDLSFPVAAADDIESYEGMLTTLPQELVISEYFNFGRFNEIVVTLPMPGLDRLFTPTAVVEPGPDAIALAAEYAKRRITIDDGRSTQNSDPAIHSGNGNVFDLSNRFRGGDTITGITGVVDDTFGLYRVQPTQYGTYSVVNARPPAPADVGGSVTVAAMNQLNFFPTLDLGPDICGPAQTLECRGADTAEEFDRQRVKLLSALSQLDADVIGLNEIENTPGVDPAQNLVDGLNDIFGPGTYATIDTGTIGTDAIKVGIIYRTATVAPVGSHAILDSTVDPRFIDTKSRPVLAQTFEEIATGGRFTVAVNHLKSKGSDCNDVGDPDTGDGSGNCNGTRTLAAEALVDWLATDPTGSGDPDSLIIGDLNSYDKEDPIDAIIAAGYTDLVAQYLGEHAYSFVFDGQVGYLDHALASASLAPQVTGVAEWHINADEPSLLDYDMSFKQPAQEALFEPNAYRSADHDPVIVGLDPGAGALLCAGLEATIVGGPTADVLNGTNGNDVIFAGGGDDVVNAGNGHDVVCGGFGDDTIDGGNGNDTLHGEDGDDTIDGANGSDSVTAGDGADDVDGGSGNDALTGDDGDDTIDGANGNDTIDGGPGSNTINGGSGLDTCVNGPSITACELP